MKGLATDRSYETINSILLTEPRIEGIRRELQALLSVIDFEFDGTPLEIDGFRLRNTKDWADNPSSLSDIFWHLSSVCNFSCEFCYEKGNPPGFPIQNTVRMSTEAEIDTRLKYYDPVRGTGIFTVRTAINEPFVNKNAVSFLKKMRDKAPGELISFVTNGAYLTEEVVQELKTMQPLFFNVSVYSTDLAIRKNVLKDFRGDKAIHALKHLATHEVPYMSNLVMWPSIPFEDMERTIAYAAEMKAVLLRVCLGGYSRYLPGDWKRFDTKKYWEEVVERVEALRGRYPIPILIEPNTFVRQDTEAFIDEVIWNSPAHRAGLQRGDLVLRVNGQEVKTRMQLISKIRKSASNNSRMFRPPGVLGVKNDLGTELAESAQIEVLRDNKLIKVTLNRFDEDAMQTFPYKSIAHFNDFIYGLVITDCLKYSSLADAQDIITRHGASKVLLLSSEMIEPMLRYMLQKASVFTDIDLEIRVPANNYFGGTINIGDLLVVQDYIEAIERFLAENIFEPDLVLLPSSPFASSPWGRDLTGRPWKDIERVLKIPVDLIPSNTITI